jgi:DNA invertase Pin-like site-specific DNA recombinase
MKVGYAGTSTLEQVAGFEAQIAALEAAGCEKVFREQVSSVSPRSELQAALTFVREGDVLTVTKLDRLACSVAHLGQIVAELETRKVGLKVLDLGLDTSTATGRLMLNVLGSVAEFERAMMLERQRGGIAKAKQEGRYKGRAPTAMRQAERIRDMAAHGMSRKAIAGMLGVSERSVYRALSDRRCRIETQGQVTGD